METILAIGGAIVLAGNVGAVIFKWIRPAFTIRQDVDILKEHDRNDYEALQHLNKMNRAQCNLLLCMINHMIDGNGIEEMKTTRKEITNILSE